MASHDTEKQVDETAVEQPLEDDEGEPAVEQRYLVGWRLPAAGFGLGLSVFLPALEVSVISTSLITISADLNGFEKSAWVITAYLLTYTGFLMLWSKISDLVGIRSALASSMVVFMAASAGCGASKSVQDLIILRAFQGIGGAGLWSISTIAFIKLVPPSQYKNITSIASALVSLGLILGPLVGGGINQSGDWPWVFYLNLPAGAVALLVVLTMLPRRFPNHHLPKPERARPWYLFNTNFFRKADFIGAFILLSASMLLVAALQEGNVHYPWKSVTIISLFVASGLLWIAFMLWERFASREASKLEPMFPWRFLHNRVWMGVLLGCFLSGAPLTVAVIELPQRYQIVNANSPLEAGVKLLAYAVTSPVGIVLSTIIIGKFRVPFVYCLLIGIVLQTTGFALLSTVPNTIETWPGQYGYSVVAGLGTGLSIGSLYMKAPIVVDKQDQALAVGSILQMRMLGGAVGVAVVNSALNTYMRTKLSSTLTGEQMEALMASADALTRLPLDLREQVRVLYSEAYNLQMRVVVAFSAAHILAVLIMWKKKPIRLGRDGTPEEG